MTKKKVRFKVKIVLPLFLIFFLPFWRDPEGTELQVKSGKA